MNSHEVAIRTLCRRCLYAITAFGYKKYKKGTMYLFAYRFSIMYTLYFTSVAILMKRCKILLLILLTLIFSSAAGCITSGDSKTDTMLLTPEELRIPDSQVVKVTNKEFEDIYVQLGAKEVVTALLYGPNNVELGLICISQYDKNKIRSTFGDAKSNILYNFGNEPSFNEIVIPKIGDYSFAWSMEDPENKYDLIYNITFIKNEYMVDIFSSRAAYPYFTPYWDEDMENILVILSQTICNKIPG